VHERANAIVLVVGLGELDVSEIATEHAPRVGLPPVDLSADALPPEAVAAAVSGSNGAPTSTTSVPRAGEHLPLFDADVENVHAALAWAVDSATAHARSPRPPRSALVVDARSLRRRDHVELPSPTEP
jgi:hypothetical protein